MVTKTGKTKPKRLSKRATRAYTTDEASRSQGWHSYSSSLKIRLVRASIGNTGVDFSARVDDPQVRCRDLQSIRRTATT